MRTAYLAMVLAAWSVAHGAARVPFDVRSSIEMTRLVALSGRTDSAAARSAFVLFSPDRQFFVAQTRRGDLRLDANVEQILLWKTEAILHALNSAAKKAAPKPTVLFENVAPDDASALSDIKWLNDREIVFLARGNDGHRQVYSVRVDTRSVSQRTRSGTDVVAFAAAESKLVYFARSIPVRAAAMIAGERSWRELLWPADPLSGSLELFQSSGDGAARRIDASPAPPYESEIWLAPSGKYAIARAPVLEAPEAWSRYTVFDNENEGWDKQEPVRNPASSRLFGRTQYQLVDLDSGRVRPLFDAPDGALSRVLTPRKVFWLDGGRRAIVSHTYLPLEDAPSVNDADRTRNVFVVEVDLQTLRATPILSLPFRTLKEHASRDPFEPVMALEWDAQEEALIATRRRADRSRSKEAYRKVGETWVRGDFRPKSFIPALSVELRQSNTERPKLYAVGRDCKCSMEILDPAPELDRALLGRADEFQWTDDRGRRWIAGLVYPVGYVAGRKYPLVLQTHGFRRGEFLIDGPDGVTTAFAAQPLANAGFMVLQMNEGPAVTMGPDEARSVSDAWKSAISKLIDMGLVDGERIGLIAWSRTGLHVLDLLARSPDLLRAAIVSDSVQHGYLQYVLRRQDSGFLTDFVAASGGTPESVGYERWFSRNPLYRLGTGKTAIRIEGIAPDGLLDMWETYSILKSRGRPVELVYYPLGSHVLSKPSERLASQGGCVDWMRYWVAGDRDPDPAKSARYARWDRLRDAAEDPRASVTDETFEER